MPMKLALLSHMPHLTIVLLTTSHATVVPACSLMEIDRLACAMVYLYLIVGFNVRTFALSVYVLLCNVKMVFEVHHEFGTLV